MDIDLLTWQGEDIGRPSDIAACSVTDGDVIRARISGKYVAVFRGSFCPAPPDKPVRIRCLEDLVLTRILAQVSWEFSGFHGFSANSAGDKFLRLVCARWWLSGI
ncbi:hypothetical protein [Aureimonas psammosilenae]|uniref:hypothetical protein n=1 Tax=Aureimonas psammosilenae TaxID=2495496 RepID=UPI001261243D|nr:hypothetical protein [Aureimonas psammosilenae]